MKSPTTTVTIPAPNIETVNVTIKGTSPIIFHKWSEKASRMILDKQMKKASKAKEAREPEQEFADSFYLDIDGNIAFKANAIKQAMVNSARVIDGVAMTQIRASVFIMGNVDDYVHVLDQDGKQIKLSGDVVRLEKPKDEIFGYDKNHPENVFMRCDMVRIGMGTADLRFRGMVKNWTMKFPVKFNAGVFSLEQVMNLIQTAGFSVGLAEWRPERNGDFGTFEIAS